MHPLLEINGCICTRCTRAAAAPDLQKSNHNSADITPNSTNNIPNERYTVPAPIKDAATIYSKINFSAPHSGTFSQNFEYNHYMQLHNIQ